MYTFSEHCKTAATKMRKRNNVLKALAGTTWGQHKETLVSTYKAIGRSVGEYASPIWGPIASKSNWDKLQTAQNEALRLATGCVRMTNIDHLHQETRVLPIKRHSEMLNMQYLLSCHQQEHPGYRFTQEALPPRSMKKTIMNNKADVQHMLTNNTITPTDYKKTLKTIHTTTVTACLTSYEDNKLLRRPPPEIDKTETALSRMARTRLAQLRSSYSSIVNSYVSRIDPNVRDLCPDCGNGPHDVDHLFNCSTNPTNLTVLDLWKKPAETARFLNLA
jgi:hypothetical protein